jgi:phage tail protein X
MSTLFRTRDGDVLDWICWKHYLQRSDLINTAINSFSGHAELLRDTEQMADDIAGMSLDTSSASSLSPIVSIVLEANPDLVLKGPIFDSGIHIVLPVIDTEELDEIDEEVINLWD